MPMPSYEVKVLALSGVLRWSRSLSATGVRGAPISTGVSTCMHAWAPKEPPCHAVIGGERAVGTNEFGECGNVPSSGNSTNQAQVKNTAIRPAPSGAPCDAGLAAPSWTHHPRKHSNQRAMSSSATQIPRHSTVVAAALVGNEGRPPGSHSSQKVQSSKKQKAALRTLLVELEVGLESLLVLVLQLPHPRRQELRRVLVPPHL